MCMSQCQLKWILKCKHDYMWVYFCPCVSRGSHVSHIVEGVNIAKESICHKIPCYTWLSPCLYSTSHTLNPWQTFGSKQICYQFGTKKKAVAAALCKLRNRAEQHLSGNLRGSLTRRRRMVCYGLLCFDLIEKRCYVFFGFPDSYIKGIDLDLRLCRCFCFIHA